MNELNATSESAQEGNTVVQKTIANVNVLSEQFAIVSSQIEELETDVEGVNSILEAIKTIADQTNLLALNAAIEAARAGEQGRGFAVVADEVRSLSTRTQESTGQIHEVIERLQTSSQTAIKAMKEGVQHTQSTSEMINEVGESFSGINAKVDSLITKMDHIESKTSAQESTMENLDRLVHEITEIAQSTLNTADKTSAKSQQLNQISGDLHQLVDKFKLESDD